jgi:hypothetical protein
MALTRTMSRGAAKMSAPKMNNVVDAVGMNHFLRRVGSTPGGAALPVRDV